MLVSNITQQDKAVMIYTTYPTRGEWSASTPTAMSPGNITAAANVQNVIAIIMINLPRLFALTPPRQL